LTACGGNEEVNSNANETKSSSFAASEQSEAEIKEAAEKRRLEQEQREAEAKATQTTMEILPARHDFGVIPKEKPVSKTFIIKNTGDNPLVINDAKASCGCTVPKRPEEPIMPGETGELEVTFTSKPNQAGQTISKNVTVTANIEGASQIVTITGKVED
jgi:hypothetical protein